MGGRGAVSSNVASTSTRNIQEFDTYDEYVQFMKDNKLSFQRDVNSLTAKNNKWVLDYTPKVKKLKAVSKAENLTTLQNQYDKLVARNTKLYNDNNGFAITGDMKRLEKRNKAYKEWLNNRTKLGELNQKINGLRETNRRNTTQQSNTFVNSYGEATRRNITNTTYERGQRRLEQQVRRNMGL